MPGVDSEQAETSGRPAGRLARALCVSLAVAAIVGWIFAEWLIIGLCGGLTTCPSRSWAGYYVPLQAGIAVVGLASAGRLILRALDGHSLRRSLMALMMSAALWAIVVWVQAHD